MENKRKKVSSWSVVIILLIVVPLVGVILLIKKLYQDKEGAYKNSIVARILASIMLAIGLILWLKVITVEPSAYNVFVSMLLFILPGSLLFIKGLNLKKDSARYEKYIELITNYGIVSIDAIASQSSLAYAKTAKELEGMIAMGYLENAFIDHGNRMIILNTNGSNMSVGSRRQQNVSTENTPVRSEPKKKHSKVIVCDSCGGKNAVLQGSTVECDYCGSPISYT
jgi:hypothetical protein